MDPLDAQVRQVFFDTPDLLLDRHGVVVRARRVQRRGDDTVVKLRPIVPGELPSDLWFYPDGSRILELSTKCSPDQTFQVAAETRAFLDKQGVDLSGEQQTKTKTALRFFSRSLGAATTA